MKNLKEAFCIAALLVFPALTVQGADIAHQPALPKTEVAAADKPAATEPASHAFTGLIVDARGLGLQTTFAPVIYDETGKPVYGIEELDTDLAMSRGMADYAPNPELVQEARDGKSRAGTHPMLITAVTLKDNHSVIISTADAEKILAANQSVKFLSQCAVVFLN